MYTLESLNFEQLSTYFIYFIEHLHNMFMLNFAIVCGCVAAGLAQIIPDANKLNCRICEDANDLGDCKKIAVCDSSYEECFMDEVITAQLRIVYRAGCRAKDVCEGTNPGAGVGKRAEGEEVLACSRCCKRMNDTDGCNKRLCGIVDPLRDSQCYACSSGQSETIQGDVTNPEDCVSFKTCQHNEACYARTHVSGGKVSFEYGCHQLAICEVLMQRMIVDKQACESSGNVDNCGTESLYCFTCCAWGACNYGDCKAQNKQIYDLYKKNLFDLTTLKKITSNSTTTTAPGGR